MPAPSKKSGRSQLNVWVKDSTAEYIKTFAKRRGHNIGTAVDRIVELHNYYTATLGNEESHLNNEDHNHA